TQRSADLEVLQQLGALLEELGLGLLSGSGGRRVVRGGSILFATRDQNCDDGDPRYVLGALEHAKRKATSAPLTAGDTKPNLAIVTRAARAQAPDVTHQLSVITCGSGATQHARPSLA